jgi:hypothetical protein
LRLPAGLEIGYHDMSPQKRKLMPRFKDRKAELRALLSQRAWDGIAERLACIPGREAVSPLLSFLPREGLLKWRAVLALGVVVPALAATDRDAARIVMRRLLWHLNEDSGNMGWGIAESMGEILAASPSLTEEYGHILLSYALITGRADNHIEHGTLRRGAIGA